MRELVYTIRDALGNGLRPDSLVPVNADYLKNMANAKPMGDHAEAPDSIVYPATLGTLTMAHPFPMMLRAERETLLFEKTSVSSVNETNWTTSALATQQPPNETAEAIVAGESWQLATIDAAWLATNGASIVFSIPEVSGTKASDDVAVAAVGRSGMRVAMGGMTGAWMSGGYWTKVVDTWRASLPDDAVGYESMTHGKHWIMWEDCSRTRQTPMLLSLIAMGAFGSVMFEKFEGVILAHVESGVIGLAPTNAGDVKAILPHSSGFVVYGDRAVSQVAVAEPGYREDIALNMGVLGRGAVSGDLRHHVFLDADRGLRQWIAGEGIGEPTHREFFVDVTGSPEVLISHDPRLDEYWICNSSWSYLLTRHGLGGSMTVKPTSMFRDTAGRLIGTAAGITAARTMKLVTLEVDMGRRDYKHMVGHHFTYNDLSSVQSRMVYTMNSEGSVITAPWRPVVDDVSYQTISFREGSVDVEGLIGSDDARMDRVDIRYQTEGRKHIRGTTMPVGAQ